MENSNGHCPFQAGCTAEVVTQSGTSVHLGSVHLAGVTRVARDWQTFWRLGSKSAGTLSCNQAQSAETGVTTSAGHEGPQTEAAAFCFYRAIMDIRAGPSQEEREGGCGLKLDRGPGAAQAPGGRSGGQSPLEAEKINI